MKKALLPLFVALVACCLMAPAVMAGGEKMTLTISEEHCKDKHTDHSEGSIKCVKRCVDGGAAPVAISEDGEVLKIENKDDVSAHLGHLVMAMVEKTDSGSYILSDIEHKKP